MEAKQSKFLPCIEERDLENLEKLCPVCKNTNDRNALVCGSCGAPLDESFQRATVTAISSEVPANVSITRPEALVERELIPENGIAVYAAGSDKPVYASFEDELVLGRKANETSEFLLDLSALGGFQMGLSRRHAMVRRAGTGYEIIDLGSTNGTWMNSERLIPNKPYPLASGSQLRLGRMRIFLFHRLAPENKKP